MEFAPHSPRRAAGFTLVEVLVVLVISAILLAMAALVVRAVSAGQKRSLTATRMAAVDAALVQFVILQKRLPCPANGTLPGTDANAGTETARDAVTGCTAQANGVVPWRALGLAENDILDGWDRRLTYRVWARLAADNGMDMSWCDPAGTKPAGTPPEACDTACTATALASCTPPLNFLAGKGFTIRNVAGTTVMSAPTTGAAYVVVSHGSTGGGAYLPTGTLATSTTTDGTEEARNYATVGAAGPFVDDSLAEGAGVTHFDDLVSRPTVLSVVNKAGLGPRAH